MSPDHPHGMQEGQLVRVAAGPAAGLVDQLPQGEMDQQQAVEFLLDQVDPTSAQHQARPGQGDLEFSAGPLALPAFLVQRS